MPPRATDTRRAGLFIAGGLALVGVGAVALMLVRGNAGGSANASRGTVGGADPARPLTLPTPVDVTAEGLRQAGRARFQFVDRLDPARVVGQLEWQRLEPLPDGQALVDQPVATIRLSQRNTDGGLVLIRAQRGTIYTPPGSEQPERGTFEGGVTVELFAPRAADPGNPEGDRNGQAPAAPAATGDGEENTPTARLFASSMTFDLSIGQARIAGDFRVSTPAGEMAARGLRAVGHQAQRRLESLTIDQTRYVRVSLAELRDPASVRAAPGRAAPLAPAESLSPPDAASPVAASDGPTNAGGVEAALDVYQTELTGPVRVALGGVQLRSPRLWLWASLIDGRLPGDALGPAAVPSSGDDGTPSAVAGADAAGPRPTPDLPDLMPPLPGEPPSLARLTSADAALLWSGPLVLTRRDAMPEEFAGERVALRADAGGAGDRAPDGPPVRITAEGDAASGAISSARARAARLDYLATSRRVRLEGDGEHPVSLGVDGRTPAALTVPRVEADLAAGVVVARGAGTLVGLTPEEPGEPGPRTVSMSWAEQADLTLRVRDGWATDRLDAALVQGAARVDAAGLAVRAGFARAQFGEAGLSALALGDGAEVWAGGPGAGAADGAGAAPEADASSLRAESVRVSFSPGVPGRPGADGRPASSGTPEPAALRAEGSVRVCRGPWELSADALDAELARDERQRVTARGVVTRGRVRLTEGALVVRADELRAQAQDQVADLIGSVRLERDGAEIRAEQARADGASRELFVHGPGTFAYQPPAAEGADADANAAPRVEAAWSSWMRVDDDAPHTADTPANAEPPTTADAGRAADPTPGQTLIECAGDTRVSLRRGPGEEDTLAADRLVITLEETPPDSARLAAATSTAPAPGSAARRFARAEASGSQAQVEGGAAARAQSRRWAVGEDGSRGPLQRVVAIDADRILAQRGGTLFSIPGPGRLLVDERREPSPTTAALGGQTPSGVAAPAEAEPRAALPGDLASGSGTSLFSWREGLTFDRAAGTLEMLGAVRLLHRPAPDEPVTLLESSRLAARLRTPESPAPLESAGPRQAELLDVDVAGAVTLIHPGGTLRADRLRYDALAQTGEALAEGDNRVIFEDPAQPTPVTAERLVWDLRRGRFTVQRPGPVTIPR